MRAFAVTTDQARQNAVWETVGQQGYRPGAWQIKRLLTEDRVPATSAIVHFVGLEAYEARAAGSTATCSPRRTSEGSGSTILIS